MLVISLGMNAIRCLKIRFNWLFQSINYSFLPHLYKQPLVLDLDGDTCSSHHVTFCIFTLSSHQAFEFIAIQTEVFNTSQHSHKFTSDRQDLPLICMGSDSLRLMDSAMRDAKVAELRFAQLHWWIGILYRPNSRFGKNIYLRWTQRKGQLLLYDPSPQN